MRLCNFYWSNLYITLHIESYSHQLTLLFSQPQPTTIALVRHIHPTQPTMCSILFMFLIFMSVAISHSISITWSYSWTQLCATFGPWLYWWLGVHDQYYHLKQFDFLLWLYCNDSLFLATALLCSWNCYIDFLFRVLFLV